jgi:aryl-alcohol dehydrogenase-like predicted oxidoreductase
MSYGSPEWQGWVLGEDEGIAHIKAAYDLGINAFDTSNVRSLASSLPNSPMNPTIIQTYSNGESETILGKAIKQHNLPRDEIVVMTKVRFELRRLRSASRR